MDPKDYRDYLFSAAYFRNRVLWICLIAIGVAGVEWLGLLEGADSTPPRAFAVLTVTAVIVAVWVVVAVLGAVGLYRWLRE